MNTACILYKKAGQDVPSDLLALSLKNNQTAFGVCLQDKNGADTILDYMGEAKALTLDAYNSIEGMKDIPAVMWFGNITQDFDKVNNLQPFLFQMAQEKDKDGNQPDPENILAVYIEGDFPKYNKPGAGNTDEYNLWEDYLFPTLLEKFELASGDPEDFYARLRTKQFTDSVLNTIGHRGVVAMLPLDGEPIVISQNELGISEDWGWTSNRYTYGDKSTTEKVAEAATSVVAAVKGRTSRLARALGTTAPAPEKPVEAAPPAGPNNPPGPGIHTVQNKSGNRTLSGNKVKIKPPAGLQGNARNTWIRTFLQLSPDDPLPKEYSKDARHYEAEIPVELADFAQEAISTKEEARALQSRVKSFLVDGTVTLPEPKPEEVKNPPKVDKPAEQPADDKRPTKDFLPELSADDKRGAVELVTGWASKPSDKVPTALEIQRIESKYPAFSVLMGIKLEDMLRWSIADKKALAKKYPDAMALAFTELQLKVMETSGVKLDTAPKPADKQVEVPSPQPGPAPAKTSRLARLTGSGKAA